MKRGGWALGWLLVACGNRPEAAPPPDAGFVDVPGADVPVSCATTGVSPTLDVRYTETAGVEARFQSLDVYRPTRASGCGPTPVMVWVHGGGWSVGDKRNQLTHKVPWFTGRGWLFVSVNYRLSPTPVAIPEQDPGRVRYPTHNEDVAAAVAWVRAHAAEYGADPSRIALMGHSAGAGITSQLATNPRFLTARGLALSDLRCAVALDTEAYDVAQSATGRDEQAALYQNAFGSDPAVWREASAIHHVGAGVSPFFVVTRGAAARVAMSTAFVTALQGVGVRSELVQATGYDHEGVNDAIGAPSDTIITPRLEAFLQGCR